MAQTYEEMDAIAMLKADHRKVEDIFEQFEKATSRAGNTATSGAPSALSLAASHSRPSAVESSPASRSDCA